MNPVQPNHVYIFVPGLLSLPAGDNDWPDRAVRWIHYRTPWHADFLEYAAGIITGRLLNWWRARKLIALCRRYPGSRLILVGHSNGANVITRALPDIAGLITEVHLFAAACPADLDRAGLNDALADYRIGQLIVYLSRADGTLAAAKKLAGLLRLFWLDYGWLGLDGPANIRPAVAGRVTIVRKDQFGHTTWFAADKFDTTMQLITGLRSRSAAPAHETTLLQTN